MGYKILLVDDDTELVKMLSKYFERKKYRVITAQNGKEAIEKLQTAPDIILLDINMPQMDGLEVCRKIRDKISCPILFLTARVEEEDRVNGLLSGGDDYILKPFSLKELDARITAHLKREQRHSQNTEFRFHGELCIDYGQKNVQINEEIIELLKNAGFDYIKTYGDFKLEAPQKDSERVFFVCKKFYQGGYRK